jgi:peptidoglycan/xylan/chitin deacetylase (PgdA/CDA1 family)
MDSARDTVIRLAAPLAERVYRQRPRIRVIAFHDVPDRGAFAAKMRTLGQKHNVVSLEAALERTALDWEKLNVALTFDDGFEEHAKVAAQVLRELGLPATFFVPSGSLDLSPAEADLFSRKALRRNRPLRFLKSEDVAALATEPAFEIGGHTTHHVEIARLGEEELGAEVGGDKAALEGLTGKPLRFFAFPFGSPEHVSPPSVRAVAEAGYRAAFTIVPALWSWKENPYLVGRTCLSADMDDRLWEASLRGGNDVVSAVKCRRCLR